MKPSPLFEFWMDRQLSDAEFAELKARLEASFVGPGKAFIVGPPAVWNRLPTLDETIGHLDAVIANVRSYV